MTLNDTARAAVLALIQSVFPVLLIAGVVELDEAEIGAIMLFVANALTVIALVVKTGQEQGPQ